MPVYVRGGSIIPIAPLTQSTQETPNGPLTLRIFPPNPGEPCEGSVYTDDGHSLDYRKGIFARVRFTCAANANGSYGLTLAKQEGTWKPWWHEYRVEVVGWAPTKGHAAINGKSVNATQVDERWGVTLPFDAEGGTISSVSSPTTNKRPLDQAVLPVRAASDTKSCHSERA